MASSSVQQKHQVFLSFRGQDTRLNFTSHLHEALKGKGIDTFIDDQLIRGDEISPALLTAIQESTISIIVLSKNYASSSWCLDELSKILECKERKGQIVVPIFYHVDPSHVRNQKGSFEEAFEKHQERFKDRTDKVERWRDALKEVGNLSGYHIHGQPNDRPESKLIVEIVKDISKKLMYKSVYDTQCLIGIDFCIQQVESLLCFDSEDVRIVGIWGMGGIGKTTIAEVVYNQFFAEFEGCCFLSNVKEKYGRFCLREDLFSKILEDRNLNVGTSLLPAYIKDRVQHKKVLIVLDDVDDSTQLHLLLRKRYFGPGSRIILTSRDKQVLQPVVDEIYGVEELNHNEALELFSLCAFKQSHPKAKFVDVSKRVVDYAKGVPLALRVLGSALYGKSKLFWEGELNKLKEIPNPKINSILIISFDGLDDEVKDIFLDIACFFKSTDRDYVADMLDGCYRSVVSGISVLIDKSLITIQHKRLEMHDLVQQMAWNIAHQDPKGHGKLIEPGKCRRLWNPKDIYHVLKNDTGTGKVTGMFLDMSQIGELHLRPEAFERMFNLRFLKFYYSGFIKDRKVFLSQQSLESLPNTVICLYWENCPLKSLPSKFCPENLVELCMTNSPIKQLWNGVQNLVKLKRLNLNNSQQLIEIPDLSRATNLELISLAGCTSLVEVPSSIEYLNNLRYLGLGCCENTYEEFPDSRLYFSIDYCSNITKFPKIPRSVESLCLSGIAIEEVPPSIGCLSRLTYLCLKDCSRLKKLPSSICKLKLLEELHLGGCLKLESFPEILETMECLEFIDLSGTPIEELPWSIEHLVGLKRLWLHNCQNLKKLPSSIGKLNSLESLDLVKCSTITKFGEIRGDQNLVGNRKSLKKIRVSDSSLFEELTGNLEKCRPLPLLRFYNPAFSSPLISLNLSGNDFVTVPASINHLLELRVLRLCYCKRLQSLPDQLPPNLHILYAHNCTSLEAVSGALPITRQWNDGKFIFTNCINLDQKAILAKTQLQIQQMATKDVKLYHRGFCPSSSLRICFPGSEIPQWFNCQNLGSCVTTQFSPYLDAHKFVGFALCIVVTFNDLINLDFECRCNFKINGDNYRNFSFFKFRQDYVFRKFIGSDHLLLVYDLNLYPDLDDGENNYHLNEASFEFSVCHFLNKPVDSCVVKKCGVRPLYDQVPHPSSESESDAGECNPLMIQTSSSSDPTGFSLKCGVNNQDFGEPMVEDGAIIK